MSYQINCTFFVVVMTFKANKQKMPSYWRWGYLKVLMNLFLTLSQSVFLTTHFSLQQEAAAQRNTYKPHTCGFDSCTSLVSQSDKESKFGGWKFTNMMCEFMFYPLVNITGQCCLFVDVDKMYKQRHRQDKVQIPKCSYLKLRLGFPTGPKKHFC